MRIARATVDGQISLHDLTPQTVAALRKKLGTINPELFLAQQSGQELDPAIPRWLSFITEHADGSVSAPRGAIRAIREVLGNQYQLKITDHRSFGDPLNLTPVRRLRDYQQLGAELMLSRGQGMGILPCGGGKTILALGALSMINRTTLVIVPTIDLVEQWACTVVDVLGIEPSIFGAGKHKLGPFTIATKDAIHYHREKLDLTSFGALVVDEAHRVPTRIFQDVLHRIPAAWRIGLTATPDRSDGMGKLVEASFGERLIERTVPQLLEGGWLVLPEVIGIKTAFYHALPGMESRRMQDYTAMTSKVAEDSDRNELIADLIAKQTESTLVLSNRKEHCRELAKLASRRGVTSLEVLVGSDSKGRRKKVLDRMRSGELQIVLATSLADEGLDVRRLTIGILALPERSPGRTRQRAGRLMRPFGEQDSKQAKLYDIVDWLTPNLRSRWQSRCQEYRSLGIKPRFEETLLEKNHDKR